tara:strand:- start:2533 stop:3159 length:627 start_codon:yes stop_codon:yes gene_type:complete
LQTLKTKDKQWSQLMKQVQQGNEKSYQLLLEDITVIIKKFITNKLFIKDDCDDLVQSILISIHESRQSFNTDQSFSNWFFAIARYKLADYYTLEKKRTTIKHHKELKTNQQDYSDNIEIKDELNQLLSILSEHEKQIIIFSKIHGYSLKHIASLLNKTESSIKISIHRSIKKLQKQALHTLPSHYAAYILLNKVIWSIIIKGYLHGQN